MIESLRLAWSQRTTREQRLLLVMFGLLGVVVLWLGIIRPLGDALSEARERLYRATVESGLIAARADDLRLARRLTSAQIDSTLAIAVSTVAAEVGFDLARLDPQGADRVQLAIATARGGALFDWLNRLQRRGIFVERMTIRPNSDATLAVEATLRARRI